MVLKALEIQGFKSFPEKTRLDFSSGITAVVGPNGSGKSNIADAISWVLGEQSAKSLRGGKMEDVIFGGTQRRRPTGFAQVTITFDNENGLFDMEAMEVSITRKYYRSGESEYFINKNAVRLRDVNELLMDTGLGRDGYSIIGQGRIAEIVGAKSGERREVFEEAAGISKFRYRREQTEKQLSLAEENILRLQDILLEIEGRLEPLRIQSEKAQLFLALSSEKKDLEISVLMENLGREREQLKEHENRIMVVKAQYDGVEEEIAAIESEMAEVYQEMNRCSLQVEEIRSQKKDLEERISKNAAQRAVMENNIFHEEENSRRLQMEKAALSGGKTVLLEKLAVSQDKLEQLKKKEQQEKKEFLCLEEQLASLLEKSSLEGDHLQEITAQILDLQEGISKKELLEQTAKTTITELESSLSQIAASQKGWKGELERLYEEQAEQEAFQAILAAREKELKKSAKEEEAEEYRAKEKLRLQQEKVDGLRFELNGLHQRIDLLKEMEESMEGVPFGVKAVLKEGKNGHLLGIKGAVSQLIQVSPNYALAIETALGASLQHIVVENEEAAKAAIHFLRDKKAGRATFLPLTAVRGNVLKTEAIKNRDGYVGLAADLVDSLDLYRPILSFLLGRIVICDTLDHATALARENRFQFRIVTLDGQVIHAGGSMTGGSAVRQGGVLSRRSEQIKRQSEWEAVQKKAEEAEKALFPLEESLRLALLKKEEGKARQKQLEEDRLKLIYTVQSAQRAQKEQEQWLSKALEEEMNCQRRLQESRQVAAVSRQEREALEEERQRLQMRQRQTDFGQNDLREKVKNLQEQIAGRRMAALEWERDRAIEEAGKKEWEAKLKKGQEDETGLENALRQSAEAVARIQMQKEGALQQNREDHVLLESMDGQIEEILKQRQNLEGSSAQVRAKERQLMGQKEDISKEAVRLEEQKRQSQAAYDGIIAALWDEYELTVSEAALLVRPVENRIQVESRLQDIKAKIKGLGSVNVGATEEYEEVAERYSFLSNQCKDVKDSREELLRLIGELTSTMEALFSDTFAKINGHFSQIFRELFGGGAASLELAEAKKVLESGIIIHVQPPGKIIKNLSALSGGEQALVAIAIYFAILKVRPAPFCLLDEIEAALDEVNVSRYAAYLHQMSSDTQFIAISHRRGTMEAADVLYGVTMQEDGISKLLKLGLHEVEEKLQIRREG